MVNARRYYVYEWFIKSTGEVFYVGKGTDNRVTSNKDRNKHFLAIKKKYDCDCRIVKEFDDEQEALDFEKEYGECLKANGFAKASYVLGGKEKFISAETRKKIASAMKGRTPPNKGKTASQETREKQSRAKKGKTQSKEFIAKRAAGLIGHSVSEQTREKIRQKHMGSLNPMYGVKQSEETIQKRVAKLKGRKVSEETRRKIGLSNGRIVIQYDIDHKEIARYPSASEAARILGLQNSKISSVCNGRRKTCGGFIWEYANPEVSE